MTFSDLNLNRSLLNALDDLGFVQPTPIQIKAFPVVMSGADVVGIAQTGTGKTFAYLLPLLRMLTFSKSKDPRILIVVPTRELVVQVVSEIEKLTKYTNFKVLGVYGGVNIKSQKQALLEGTNILVATPGRLYDLILHQAVKTKSIKRLVVDEVDEMFDLGFRTQLSNIIELLPARRQNLMFSATMTKEVSAFIQDNFIQPKQIEVAPSGTPIEKIEQRGFHAPNFYSKVNLLTNLLNSNTDMEKVLVFVASKKMADKLFDCLTENEIPSLGIIHSNKSQNFRIRNVKSFHNNETRILIATDIISRGLDISEVSHVINFDIPEVPEDYIHRIGRTGRAEKKGNSINFVSEREMPLHEAIEALMGIEVALEGFPEEVEISEELLEIEKPENAGDKHYMPKLDLSKSRGAFHEKLAKNVKVNRANEKRAARKLEKKRSRRKRRK